MSDATLTPAARFSKTDSRHWRPRLFKQRNSKTGWQATDWTVQIAYSNEREKFPLGTPDKEAGARKAVSIWLSLQTDGWAATRAKFKPWTVKIEAPPASTVGELLRQVKAISDLKRTTFEVYALKFRTLVAGVMGIQPQRRKSDFAKGEKDRARIEMINCAQCSNRRVAVRLPKKCSAKQIAELGPKIICTPCLKANWRNAVEAIDLAELTDARVQTWKVSVLKNASADPLELRSARATVASILRSSKSLFSKKVRKHLTVPLPDPLPLSNVTIERVTNRYSSKINPHLLAQIAKRELEVAHPEHFKIFILGLAAGLRRSEIDKLEWGHFDWKNRRIRVETTIYGAVKNERSEDPVDIDRTVTEFFREQMRQAIVLAKQGTQPEFVINSGVAPRPHANYHHYRCNRIFKELLDWLRRNGVDAHMPLHTLRKEYGSLICQRAGIFAASSALRHSNISITRDIYTSKKGRIELPFGELLHRPEAEQMELPTGESAA